MRICKFFQITHRLLKLPFAITRSQIPVENDYGSHYLCQSLYIPVTVKEAVRLKKSVKLLQSHHFLLLSKSAAPEPILSIWTPATLAPQVVRQQQPCWYSNMSVTVMKWVLPRRKTICQALTQKVQILLWWLVYNLIGTMRSIRKCQTFVPQVITPLLYLRYQLTFSLET